jgi:hypothetical protein
VTADRWQTISPGLSLTAALTNGWSGWLICLGDSNSAIGPIADALCHSSLSRS